MRRVGTHASSDPRAQFGVGGWIEERAAVGAGGEEPQHGKAGAARAEEAARDFEVAEAFLGQHGLLAATLRAAGGQEVLGRGGHRG